MLFALEESRSSWRTGYTPGESQGGSKGQGIAAGGSEAGRGPGEGRATEGQCKNTAWSQERGPENGGRCPNGVKSTNPPHPRGWGRKRSRIQQWAGQGQSGSLSATQEFRLVAMAGQASICQWPPIPGEGPLNSHCSPIGLKRKELLGGQGGRRVVMAQKCDLRFVVGLLVTGVHPGRLSSEHVSAHRSGRRVTGCLPVWVCASAVG